MEKYINFIIAFFVLLSIFRRFKIRKNVPGMQGQGFGNEPEQGMKTVFPKDVSSVLPKALLGNKNLEKIVTVYGTGAQVGVEDVSGLLNVSAETAQEYLGSLEGQGRAEVVMSAGNKVKYKLS